MAHMIDMSNNQANIAYVGEMPWHGLGQELQPGQSIDQWRIAAGMDWKAEKAPECYYVPGGVNEDGKKLPPKMMKSEEFVIYRSDTGAKLGNCTDRYNIVQPAAVLEFYRDLCDKNGFALETAGCLDGGKRVWAMAKVGDGFAIMGQDRIVPYLLLATSFDGSLATIAQYCMTRVVCHNTISAALRENQKAIKVSHKGTFDANAVRVELGLMEQAAKEFEEQANALASVSVTRQQTIDFLFKMMKDDKAKTIEDLSTKKLNIIKRIAELSEDSKGSNFRSADGTLWGVVNGVTQFVDWERGHNTNNRFREAHFGAGDKLKTQAFEEALKLVA